jgi:energy-coupling factor transporter ATP-binding protein EcfA2
MRPHASYDQPFAWWGPLWSPPKVHGILDLIKDDVLSAETAALLWALLARRASLVVVANPSGAGKTTLLTALLAFLPLDTHRLYLRGCYEPFAFLNDPAIDPTKTVLLVNEISAHLPAYLWGPGVSRTLDATRLGFTLAATAHASSPTAFVQTLTGYPLRLRPEEIAAIDLVVVLDARIDGATVRRQLRTVAALSPTGGGGLNVDVLAEVARGSSSRLDIPRSVSVLRRLTGRGSNERLARELAERAADLNALLASPHAVTRETFGALSRGWEATEGIS